MKVFITFYVSEEEAQRISALISKDSEALVVMHEAPPNFLDTTIESVKDYFFMCAWAFFRAIKNEQAK